MRRLALAAVALAALALAGVCRADLQGVANDAATDTKAHRTDRYAQMPGQNWLVLRRGAPFRVRLTGSSASSTSVVFTLTAKSTSQPMNAGGFSAAPQSGGWWTLNTPATAAIAVYTLTATASGSSVTAPFKVVLLANPMNPSDAAYVPDDGQREEYVFNDNGMIWLGSSDSNSPRPWQYGQFAGAALAVAMQLMDASGGLPLTQRRGDLTQLTRFFSKWINVNDDNGVLVGRWSEPYSDGTEPWVWTGSDAIFRQFFQTGRPVKYGQCWVFSGCLTSILRAVGLAARSITNFESAHEPAPYQFTIDRYWVQRNGQWQQSDMRGSIWNFHAWTDVWISRSDISDASGWQAVDATPQETSGGYFQLGPASLAMVRANERDSQYDADFVISETNADVVDWVQQSGKWVVYARDTKTVGQLMSTKAVGSNSRDDITSDYKTESDSIEAGSRRARVLGARPRGSGKQLMLLDGADWHVDVHVPNAVALGANVSITVSVSRRPGSAPVNLTLNSLVVNLTDYTNSNPVQIDWLDAPYAMPLLGNTTSLSHVFTVLPTAYQSLVSNGFTYLTVVAWAASDAPGPNFMMAEANSRLVQPDMSIVLMDASGQVTSSFRVGDTVRAEFAFTNPLSIALTHVTVHAEISSGYNIAPITVSDVGPMQQMRVPYTGTATTASDSPISIVVILDCDQLDGVTGYAQIRVSPADEPEHKSPLLSPLGIALTTVACVVLLGVGVAVGVAIARRRRASNDAKASVQDEAVATGDYASDANYAKLPGDG